VFETALNETVGLREGEKVRLVSKKEALVRTVLQRALQGDPKAFTNFITFLRATSAGMEAEPEAEEQLTPDEWQVVEHFVRRKGGQLKG